MKRAYVIVLALAAAPMILFAQHKKAREHTCYSHEAGNAREISEEYSLVATTFRRWLREGGRFNISSKNDELAVHNVKFRYLCATKPCRRDKTCQVVSRYFQYEWVRKNNLVQFKKLRRKARPGPAGVDWDFKARSLFAGRKVRQLYEYAADGKNFKVLSFSRPLPFQSPGIVVLAKENSSFFLDYQDIINHIKDNKDYYQRDSDLVVLRNMQRFPIK